jgi:aldose sugar dehydrogenase
MVGATCAAAVAVAACGGSSDATPTETAAAQSASNTSVPGNPTSATGGQACTPAGDTPPLSTQTIASGLTNPWAMAFLPEGRILVTQKAGQFVIVSADGSNRSALTFTGSAPSILESGQGGLLDVALDPDFASTPWVYFTYQEPGTDGQSNLSGTAVGRARLTTNADGSGGVLSNFERLYQQLPKVAQGGVHFGSRIAFRADKTLLVTLGDRGMDKTDAPSLDHAQHLGRALGKIVRLNRDGSVPNDNPFAGRGDALPEIWSLGHRNPQGLTVDRANDAVWSSEHGPQGGDEINQVRAGNNHGWPLRSYGCTYGSPAGEACRLGGGVHTPYQRLEFSEPMTYWAPQSTAPSNLVVLRNSAYPAWEGQLLVGALAGKQVWRVASSVEGRMTACEPVLRSDFGQRVRDLRQASDGRVWLLTDEGFVHRLQVN